MMPFNYVIGHYHPFPEAIPFSEAGYSRVTHPSATKIINKSIISVRLACVRRAASVHPEPGSNSLKSCISKAFAFNYPVSLRITRNYCFIVFSDFSCLFLIKNQGISRVVIFVNVQFSKCLCFIYLSETAYLLYHSFLNLSSTFQKFLWFFISSSKAFIVLSNQFLLVSFTLSDDLFIISHIFHFVKYFFRLFSKSFCDCRFRQATCLL